MDEGRKHYWIFGIVGVIMIGIVYIWLAYFSNLVSDGGGVASVDKNIGDFSFFRSFKSGLAIVYGFFADKISGLIETIGGSREVIIQS